MFGLGTIINSAAIIAGGLVGLLAGNVIKKSWQQSLQTVCGISVMFIGISGAIEKMMTVENNTLTSHYALMLVLCLVIGTLIGEIIDIEGKFDKFGEYLKQKTNSSKDNLFVEAFVNASLTVCIGAMAVMGSINDGLYGDYSILATKSVLDFVIILVMCTASGKGALFSFIPVFIVQGVMTVLARALSPLLTDLTLSYISLIGSTLIFSVGINLVFGYKVKVANMLPSLLITTIYSLLK